jgi:hypothetical protein
VPGEVTEITSSNVFEYQNEVIVELHGRTADGELTVLSYSFEPDTDDETHLTPRERIEPDHQVAVEQSLEAADYRLS